jgi:hypothetical protein
MRRDDGRKEMIQGHMLENRRVVPYNPYLIRTFNCHINVEACINIKSVKYLFKYIYKGNDRASVAVKENGKKMQMGMLMRSRSTERLGGWGLQKRCEGYTPLIYTSVTHRCKRCNFIHGTRLNEF